MSRRVPLSHASEVVSALRECHGRIAWADMPPTLRSDDQAAYDATALGLAELGLAGRPAGDADRAALLRDWRTLVPQDVSMVARWTASPHVYDFDPSLAGALEGTGVEDVPSVALAALPYPIQYVRCGIGGYDGFLAWHDRDPEGVEGDMLSLVFLRRDSLARARYYVPLDGTVGDFVRRTAEQDEEWRRRVEGASNGRPVGVRIGDIPSAQGGSDGATREGNLAALVSGALSLLLYVCSQEADVEVTYRPPSGGRGQRVGRRTNPETVHGVGARVGRALGAPVAAYGAVAQGGHRTVSPHVRRAHWQHYWVGPRKGRDDGRHGDELIVKWIPPIAVLGGGGTEVVHAADE